jgi:acyl-CoA synthetase (NDP forming)
MPEVLYFLLKKLALLQIKLKAGFSELVEHLPQVEQVLLEHAANHDHVVWLYDT